MSKKDKNKTKEVQGKFCEYCQLEAKKCKDPNHKK